MGGGGERVRLMPAAICIHCGRPSFPRASLSLGEDVQCSRLHSVRLDRAHLRCRSEVRIIITISCFVCVSVFITGLATRRSIV